MDVQYKIILWLGAMIIDPTLCTRYTRGNIEGSARDKITLQLAAGVKVKVTHTGHHQLVKVMTLSQTPSFPDRSIGKLAGWVLCGIVMYTSDVDLRVLTPTNQVRNNGKWREKERER